MRATGFNAIADEESFLVSYPDGFDNGTDIGALIDDVADRVAVDLGRIYVTGFSLRSVDHLSARDRDGRPDRSVRARQRRLLRPATR